MDAFAPNRPLPFLSPLRRRYTRPITSLFVLQDLMLHIEVQEKLAESPRPCDWFDLIVGTSNGRILALLLGRLKMSINDPIEDYKGLLKDVFDTDTRTCLGRVNPFAVTPKYSAEKLEAAIRKIAGEAKLADTEEEPKCRVAIAVVMLVVSDRLPDLLRTYKTTAPPHGCTFKDAAWATSAATTFLGGAWRVCLVYGVLRWYESLIAQSCRPSPAKGKGSTV